MANAKGLAVKGKSAETMIKKEYPEQEVEPIPIGIPTITEYRVRVVGGIVRVKVKWIDVEKEKCEESTNFYWLRQYITYCLALYNPGVHLLDKDWSGKTTHEGPYHFTQVSADKFEWTSDLDMVFEPHPTIIRLNEIRDTCLVLCPDTP